MINTIELVMSLHMFMFMFLSLLGLVMWEAVGLALVFFFMMFVIVELIAYGFYLAIFNAVK